MDKDSITSIRMVNLNDAVTTMYPLLEPAFESICDQVYELQTLEGVTYATAGDRRGFRGEQCKRGVA